MVSVSRNRSTTMDPKAPLTETGFHAGEGKGSYELPHPSRDEVGGHEADVHGLETGAEGGTGTYGAEENAPPDGTEDIVRVPDGDGQTQQQEVRCPDFRPEL